MLLNFLYGQPERAGIGFGLMGLALFALPAGSARGEIDYNQDVRSILSENCFSCHGPDEKARKAKLRLDTEAGAKADRDGVRALVPGDVKASALVERILLDVKDEDVMPPVKSHKRLTTAQKETLVQWVKEGGKYAEHWSFVPPAKQGLPGVTDAGWVKNGIDHFVLARLEALGIRPEGEADRTTLIRRVTLDLTGLPPTPAEVEAFVNDASPNAYEAVVDRLLASKRFGERMALAWMDAARYGDSSVMHADGPRDMWPWRDWVIRAYNNNKPYDVFTVEQLAGDLLPDATAEQKVATGFNRNHATSDEGGAIDEELRVDYVVDRVSTTSKVWLGLSFECAQCHDHKYDPITMREYYQFFAYFNNTTDPGMQTRNGNQAPVVDVPDVERDAGLAEIALRRSAVEADLEKRRSEVNAPLAAWITEQRKALAAGGAKALPAAGLVHHIALDAKQGEPLVEAISGEAGALAGKHVAADRGGNVALNLDGGTVVDFKNTGNFPEFNAGFTLSAWVMATGDGPVFSRMDEKQAFRGYDLWIQGGAIGTHIINTWQANAVKVVAKKPLKRDAWQHVTMVYDGSGKAAGVKLYVDGVLEPHNVEADNLTATIKTGVPFRIGGRYGNAKAKCQVDEIRLFDRALTPDEVVSIKDSGDALSGLLAMAPEKLTEAHKRVITDAFLASTKDVRYGELVAQRAAVDVEISKLESGQPKVTSMVMEDNPEGKKRMTYILDRGHYESPIKDQPVEPGVPAVLPPLPADAPPNRLALAQWLVTKDHPLTARVAVNQFWALLFGRGLVGTVMDFGSQGEIPSHPELLDWLAVDFVESGWDMKRALRQMVTSATYRQAARISPDLRKRDPENLWLARGARFRLQGEFIRDGALAVSGLLVEKIGGPSVKPYQLPGIWNEVSLDGGLQYPQDSGEKLYRRSMYTYGKRSAPAPNMMIFDTPTREKCVVMRTRTNTPLQALVTLNDVHFVEASRKFAERLVREGGGEFTGRVRLAFQLAVSRAPTPEEVAICQRVYDRQLASFQADPGAAEKYLKSGESPRDAAINPVELAAWAVVANMILNLDEFLMRG